MRRRAMFAALALLASPVPAQAEPALTPQLQADLGLTVVNLAYEHPVAARLALAVETGIFGTYFLPWFDLGDDVMGFNGGVRATWFARTSGRGLYVTPYLRVAAVRGEPDARGLAVTGGVFVGWAFRLTDRHDLRVGAGVQYIHIDADPLGADTPFLAIDGLLGFRL